MNTEFALTQECRVDALDATIQDYVHRSTGTRHVHIGSDDPELAFLVGFPTLPERSDGCPHILEHLVLTGSTKYPVRDPFFAMMRRSMATFMNALTYADRTIYPYSTVDQRDYWNLMDVFLDAVFFPRLDHANFLQEGWRLELQDDELQYQGVVLNEMKGAMADPMRHVYLALQAALFPGTTYAVNSGGDPSVIPSLSHETLLRFHAEHYHPSQAVVMTWGRVDARAVQAFFEYKVLSRFRPGPARRMPGTVSPPEHGVERRLLVPAAAASDREHGVQRAWVLGETRSTDVRLQGKLLEAALLGFPGAPLLAAMESLGTGRPSPINAVEDETMHVVLHAGMTGLQGEQVAPARRRIEDALAEIAQRGVDPSLLESAMRRIRYELRRDTKGVSRLIELSRHALRGHDVCEVLGVDAQADRIAVAARDPDYVKSVVSRMLATPHQVSLTVEPNRDHFSGLDADERARLAVLERDLDDAGRAAIEADRRRLLDARHAAPEVGAELPRLRLSDLSRASRGLVVVEDEALTAKAIAASGLSHAFLKVDVSEVVGDDIGWLDLYCTLLPQLGVRNMSFDKAALWRQQRASDFSASLQPVNARDGAASLELGFSCTVLREQQDQIADVLTAWLEDPYLEEQDRIRFLIHAEAQRSVSELNQEPERFAHLLASAGLSSRDQLEQLLQGLTSVAFRTQVAGMLATDAGYLEVLGHLRRTHALVMEAPRHLICAAQASDLEALATSLRRMARPTLRRTSAPPPIPAPVRANAALHAPASVNACSVAWAVPRMGQDDAAPLHIAAALLEQQLLHRALRELGGAYVVSAQHDWQSGVFSVRTARDPRLAETFSDIEIAITQLLTQDFGDEAYEEAVLSTVKELDAPMFPAQEILFSWRLGRSGIEGACWASHREQVLNCPIADVRAAVARWLPWTMGSKAASVGRLGQDLAGLDLIDVSHLSTPSGSVLS